MALALNYLKLPLNKETESNQKKIRIKIWNFGISSTIKRKSQSKYGRKSQSKYGTSLFHLPSKENQNQNMELRYFIYHQKKITIKIWNFAISSTIKRKSQSTYETYCWAEMMIYLKKFHLLKNFQKFKQISKNLYIKKIRMFWDSLWTNW